jgi:hypothetical protein
VLAGGCYAQYTSLGGLCLLAALGFFRRLQVFFHRGKAFSCEFSLAYVAESFETCHYALLPRNVTLRFPHMPLSPKPVLFKKLAQMRGLPIVTAQHPSGFGTAPPFSLSQFSPLSAPICFCLRVRTHDLVVQPKGGSDWHVT